MTYHSPFSREEVVERARGWVGKPTSRAEWRPVQSCAHLMAYVYGWPRRIPPKWLDLTAEYLVMISGWKRRTEREPGDLALFFVRERDHVGIVTSRDSFVHAGTRCFAEVSFDRYESYYRGVLIWQ